MQTFDPIQHRAHRTDFNLSDRPRALNVPGDAMIGIDQLVGRIGQECRAFARSCPQAFRIRMGRELGFNLQCCTGCRIV